MPSDRVRAVQERRRSNAAGTHRTTRPRSEVERAAITDQEEDQPMSDQDPDVNVVNAVIRYWAPTGPHTPWRMQGAAEAIDHLARYLAHATSHSSALPHAGDVYQLIGELRSAAGRMEQVLAQLAGRAASWADDPTLYDDRGDGRSPGHTAEAVGLELTGAQSALATVAAALDRAQNAAGHLGHDHG